MAGVKPLAGVTVVSLEQAVAAPFATRQLADLGARVIKIERPGVGDFARGYDEAVRGQSSYFVWLNRSKQSLTLDIKSPDGRRVLDELLDRADVFVQNLGPGAAERLGLDATTLAGRWPSLVTCVITGFGADGPWAGRKAYDLMVQFETGLVSLTGTETDVVRTGVSVADIAAGMYAYSGVLTALYTRAVTGVAHPVSVSLFDALAEWMGQPAYYTAYGPGQPARSGAAHATIAPYGPYRTGGGGAVLVVVQHDRDWAVFCREVLARPDLVADPRFVNNAARVAHRAELNAVIEERFAPLDADAARALLDRAGIANARLNDVPDFLAHPVLAERERWSTVATPGGEVRALLPPAVLGGSDVVMGPVPAVGEHTDHILAELGHGPEQIAALRAARVV